MKHALLGSIVVLLVSAACTKPSAPVEAAVVVDSAPPPRPLSFCQKQAPAPRFCEDFDSEAGFEIARVLTAQGQASVGPGEGSAKSLHVTTSPNDAGEGARATLRGNTTLDQPIAEVHFAFRARVGALDAPKSSPLSIADLSVGSYSVTVVLDGTSASAVEVIMGSEKKKTTALASTLPSATWVPVQIDFLPGKALKISIGGQKVLDVVPLVGSKNVQQVDFSFGVRQESPATTNDVSFDDVVLDAT